MMRTLTAMLAGALLVCSIAAAEPAVPMRLALLVDTSEATKAAITQLRSGVSAFVDALPPGNEIILVSTGRRVQVRVPPTTDYDAVRKSAKSLLVDGGSTPLADALLEIDERFMRRVEGRAPVFVIVTGDGGDSSVRIDAFNEWLPTLPRHAVAHAIVIKTGNGMSETVARVAVEATRGHLELVGITGGVVEQLSALAHSLTASSK